MISTNAVLSELIRQYLENMNEDLVTATARALFEHNDSPMVVTPEEIKEKFAWLV